MITSNLLKRVGISSPATTQLKKTGVSLSNIQGGVLDPARLSNAGSLANPAAGAIASAAGSSKSGGGSGGTGGSSAGMSDADRAVLNNYVQSLYDVYRPEKLSYQAMDADALRLQIAEWLRPSYDSAIASRQKQTETYRAELDADAISRGMGSSTYVTDVKSRQMQAEAGDIASLEGEYGAQLGKLTTDAADKERDRALTVAMQNQEQEQAAYALAYQAALNLFAASLAGRSTSGTGGGSGSSSVSTAASAAIKGTTAQNCEQFLSLLTPTERYAVYSGTDAKSRRYREELLASVGGDGYLDLVRRYPYFS